MEDVSLISKDQFKKLIGNFSTLSDIVVVGDIGIDKYTYGEVRRISPEAPVPVLEVSKEWMALGMASNISYNLNALKISSKLVGVIGKDKNAEIFRQILEENNLSTVGLVSSGDRPTSCKERITTKGQQICRVDYESKKQLTKSTELEFLDKVAEVSVNCGALILEDYGKGALTKDILAELIKNYKKSGKLVCVDPSRNTPPIYYKGATLLKPNLLEAKMMAHSFGYQGDSIAEIAKVLLDNLELEKLVITLGGDGMALVDQKEGGGLQVIPTVAQEVFDVSGAGDTAIGLITAGLLAGGTLAESAWIGNCGSGVVVAKIGTATVSIEELQGFYQELARKLH